MLVSRVSAADAARLAAYLREIGGDEGPAPMPDSISTIWPATAVPAQLSDNDTAAITVGTRFRSDLNGYITAIRFYKGPANTGTHVGALWNAAGQQLASVTFTGETASGWQQANLASPVAITANTIYVVGYHAPKGQYPGDDDYFAAAGVDNPPLHALRDGDGGANGVYRYGSTLSFPNLSYRSENYWVDVAFASSAADTTAPSVFATTPPAGATGVSRTTAIAATFSEAIEPATLTASTFLLRDAAGTTVNAALGYDAATTTGDADAGRDAFRRLDLHRDDCGRGHRPGDQGPCRQPARRAIRLELHDRSWRRHRAANHHRHRAG